MEHTERKEQVSRGSTTGIDYVGFGSQNMDVWLAEPRAGPGVATAISSPDWAQDWVPSDMPHDVLHEFASTKICQI